LPGQARVEIRQADGRSAFEIAARDVLVTVPIGVLQESTATSASVRPTRTEPLEGTLFFAGEATGTGGSTGTVDGAIETRRRAAKQLLRSLGS
jgi:hypothetical protein